MLRQSAGILLRQRSSRNAVQYILAEKTPSGKLKPANLKNVLEEDSSGVFTTCKTLKKNQANDFY